MGGGRGTGGGSHAWARLKANMPCEDSLKLTDKALATPLVLIFIQLHLIRYVKTTNDIQFDQTEFNMFFMNTGLGKQFENNCYPAIPLG